MNQIVPGLINCTIFDIFEETTEMHKIGFLFLFICFSFTGTAQEIPAVVEVPEEFKIHRVPIRPSLSILAPDVPNTGRFRLTQVNFDQNTMRREVNMTAVMEREEQMKTRILELAPPVRMPQPDNTSTVSRNETFSLTPRFYNPSFSPEMRGRGTRNSVYRNAADGTGATYLQTYSPFIRGYGRGFYYY